MKKNYTHLIYRSLEGGLDEDQQKMLDEWLQADKANELNYQQLVDIWRKSGGDHYPALGQELDIDGAYDKVMSKVKKPEMTMVKNKNWAFRIAASLLVLVGFAGLMFWNLNRADQYDSFVTADERKEFTLPDNSVVWLESNTTLQYHKDFDASRTLKLDGVATFEVTHDPQKPFVISTEIADVTVLGTKFVVGAQADRANFVDVINGRVKVQNAIVASDSLILTKGMKAEVNGNSGLALSDEVMSNDMFWATKQLSYNDTPLSQIFDDLKKYYEVSIDYKEKSHIDCVFQGNFTDKPLDQIFSSLELIYDMDVEKVSDNDFTIKGSPCK